MKILVYLPIANEEVVFEGSMTEILGRLSKAIKAEAYKSIEDVEACLVALKPEKGHKRLITYIVIVYQLIEDITWIDKEIIKLWSDNT